MPPGLSMAPQEHFGFDPAIAVEVTPMFEVALLRDLKGSEESQFRIKGLPGQPPICGPGGEYFGHEWSQWRYDTLDVRVDEWLGATSAGARILDVGCATGARAADFARAGHRVTAVDCVDRAGAIADRNAALRAEGAHDAPPPITFLQADLRTPTGWPSGQRFDLVHMRRVLNFVALEPFAAFLEVMLPSLEETGRFAASFIATGIAQAADMTHPAPPDAKAGAMLYPGFHAHHFGAVYRVLREHGLTITEAFSDWTVEAGFVARKRAVTDPA